MTTSTSSKRKIRFRRRRARADDAVLGERRVQVDHVRHHGRAEDAGREQERLGAVEPGNRGPRASWGPDGIREQDLEREAHDDHADEHGDHRLEAAEAARLQAPGSRTRRRPVISPAGKSGMPKSRLRPTRRADELGEVGGHRDRLGLQPEKTRSCAGRSARGRAPAGSARSRCRAWRSSTGSASPSGSRRRSPTPGGSRTSAPAATFVAKLPGIDVGDRRDEGRAEERQDAAEALALAAQRALGGREDARLAGQRRGGRDDDVLVRVRGLARRSRVASVTGGGVTVTR